MFTTNEFFESRDHLLNWVRRVADEHGMVVVVSRSDKGSGTKKPRLFLACERSGPYREFKVKSSRGIGDSGSLDNVQQEQMKDEKKTSKKRVTGTKKCDCPFRLRGREISSCEWALDVECGVHNHPTAHDLIGHSYAGRLSRDEEDFVVDMSMSNSRPRDILFMLQQKFPGNKSTMKTIYNARTKHNVVKKGGKSQMQYLLGKVSEYGYFHHHRRVRED